MYISSIKVRVVGKNPNGENAPSLYPNPTKTQNPPYSTDLIEFLGFHLNKTKSISFERSQ